MIFITGDTHGFLDFAKLKTFAKNNPSLTRNDFVMIAGDFGGVWSKTTLEKDLKPYEALPFAVLFVDGNHENFDLIFSFPVESFCGGKVHRISDNILHLMRGQVFDIDGKTFFTFGGATSIDKAWRCEGLSWWSEEVPSYSDLDEACKNLEKVNYSVDYIVTHSCDEKALYYPPLCSRGNKFEAFPENKMLSYFEDNVKYKHWYFGHYHMDGDLSDTKTVLYDNIIRIA